MFYTSRSNLTRTLYPSVAKSTFRSGAVFSALKTSSALLCTLALLFAGSGFSVAAELVNINAADVESIATALVGIGPAKAQAIVDYREQFGAFVQLQDITNVPGIGDVTLDQIKSLITLGEEIK